MADAVRVRYRKYDGTLHWNFTAYRLGSDEHGVWLGTPAGSRLRRGTEEPLVWQVDQVLLVPAGRHWWTANFNAEPFRTEVYCDMTTVPEWHGDVLTAVDLDLDVLRRRDGTVRLVDEDEFAEHRVRYGYPPEVVAGARAGAEEVRAAIEAGAEPFGTAYRTWLNKTGGLTPADPPV